MKDTFAPRCQTYLFVALLILGGCSAKDLTIEGSEDQPTKINEKNPETTETTTTTTTSTTTTTTLPSEFAIGQSSLDEIYNYKKSTTYPRAVKLLDDKFFVLSGDENRALIYNSLPTTNMQMADVVIGDTNLAGERVALYFGAASASTLTYPSGMDVNNNKILIADEYSNRVLIYSSIPSTNGASAQIVLGQTNFTDQNANNGGISASTLNAPNHVSYDGTRVIVADTSNNRVLIWNSLPTSNGQPADIVLGQANFTTNASGTTATTLKSPCGVHSDGTRLYVADTGNHRILIWNSFPVSNAQAPDWVLGQSNFTSGGANAGGLSASSLNSPRGLDSDGTNLVVADYSNRRVLMWTIAISGHKQAANRVVGKSNFTSNGSPSPITASNMSYPMDVSIKSNKLAVADFGLGRVLIWNSAISADGQAADLVLGARDFTTYGQWGDEEVESASTLHFPSGMSATDNEIFVADNMNNRVLIWNHQPNTSGSSANFVLGQAGFNQTLVNRGGAISEHTINNPYDVWGNSNRVAVADTYNNRVLLWSSFPTANGQAADIVLGHPTFATGNANLGGRSASSINNPFGVCSDGNKLVVMDAYNHRALIWNSWPTSNGQPADLVLGQTTFTAGTNNSGGLSKSSLSYPWTCFTDGTKLVIGETYNQRVLIWNTFPTSNKQAADLVLGQVNGTSNGVNQGLSAPTAGTLSYPKGVSFRGTKLVVSDGNYRVLVWNTWPTADGQAADVVFGQPDMTSAIQGFGGLSSATSFSSISSAVELVDRYLFLDMIRSRVTVKKK